jgi:hypothetical protein
MGRWECNQSIFQVRVWVGFVLKNNQNKVRELAAQLEGEVTADVAG